MTEIESIVSLPSKSNDPARKEVDGSFNPTRLFNLINRQHWAGAEHFLADEHVEASIWIFSGKERRWEYLPLHIVCMNWNKGRSDGDIKSDTVSLIKALLLAYPEGASYADHDGNYPLHLALQSNAPVEILSSLFLAFPEAINMEDSFKKTPIERILSFDDKQIAQDLINMLMQSSVVFNKKNVLMQKENEKMKADLDETRDELTEFRSETVRLSKQNATIEQRLRSERRKITDLNGGKDNTFSPCDHIDRIEDERENEETHSVTIQDFSETTEYKDMITTIENLNIQISELTDEFDKKQAQQTAQHTEAMIKMEKESKTKISQVLSSLKRSYDEEKLFWEKAHSSVQEERDNIKSAHIALEKKNLDLESKMKDFESLKIKSKILQEGGQELKLSLDKLMKDKDITEKRLIQVKDSLHATTKKLNESNQSRGETEKMNDELKRTLKCIRNQMVSKELSNLETKRNLEEKEKNLNDTINNLNNELNEQQKSNEAMLKTVTSGLQTKIKDLEKELVLSDKARESCSSLNSTVTESLKQLRKEKVIFEEKEKLIENQLSVLEGVRSDLAAVEKEKKELLVLIEIYEKRMEEYDQQIKTSNKNCKSSSDKMQEAVLIQTQVVNKVESLEEANTILHQQYNDLLEEFKVKENKMKLDYHKISVELLTMSKKLEKSKVAHSNHLSDVQGLKEKLAMTQKNHSEKEEELKNVQLKLMIATKDKKVAEKTLEMMSEKFRTVDLNAENHHALEESNNESKAQISELTKKLSSYAMVTSSVSESLSKLKLEKYKLEQNLKACEKTKADILEELNKSSTLVKELSAKQAASTLRVPSSCDDDPFIEELKQKLLQKEKELKGERQKVEELNKNLATTARSKKVVDNVVKSLTDRVGGLSDKLQDVITERDELQSKYSHQSKVTVDLRNSLESIKFSQLSLKSRERKV